MAHEIAKLMLEHAGTFLERTEAIRTALSLGMCKRRSKSVARIGACVTVEKRGALHLTRVGVSKACNGITVTDLTHPQVPHRVTPGFHKL